MKRKNKIWKIVGATFGVAAICCIIPACVVSCGSSSNTSKTNTSNSNSNASNSSTSNSTSSSSSINNSASTNPITPYSGLVTTSVNNAESNASADIWSSTGLSQAIIIPKDYLPILNNSLSIWTLNSESSQYTISCDASNNNVTYQWYQVPLITFVDQLSNFTNDVNNYDNATLFAQLLCQNGTALVGETSNSYNFAYGTSLNDALYICKIVGNNNTSFSQLTWLRPMDAFNPANIASYSLTYYNTAELNNPGDNQVNINAVQNGYGTTLETSNGTQITFALNLNGGNLQSSTSPLYLVSFYAGSVYSPVMNLQNSQSYSYTFTASAQTTDVGVNVFGPDGMLIPISNNGTAYTISVNDPLSVADATFNVNASAPSQEITNSQGTVINQITAKQGQSITFTLSINGFSANDFANQGYTIQWFNNDNEVNKQQSLSNQSAWSYTIKAPQGTTTISYAIYGVNGNQINSDSTNNSYQIVVNYLNIVANPGETQYGSSNSIILQNYTCSWSNIKYEWQSSTSGKDWTTLASGNLNGSADFLNIPVYNVPKSKESYQYRLVVINTNDSNETLISNVISASDNLVTPTLSFNDSTSQAEFKKDGLAFENPNQDFDVSISLTQFGINIKNVSQLNGISLTLSATYLPSYEYADFTATLTTINNIASLYDVATNSIVIPINSSSLFKWTQQILTQYNNNPNGNYTLNGWYPVTLNCSINQNGYSISTSSLKFNFEQLTISAPTKDNEGMEITNNIYFVPGYQVQMTSDGTNVYNFLSQTTKYYQWQFSSNGTTDWQDVSGQTTASFDNYLNEAGYYRLVLYKSPKKEFFIASNVIHFEFMPTISFGIVNNPIDVNNYQPFPLSFTVTLNGNNVTASTAMQITWYYQINNGQWIARNNGEPLSTSSSTWNYVPQSGTNNIKAKLYYNGFVTWTSVYTINELIPEILPIESFNNQGNANNYLSKVSDGNNTYTYTYNYGSVVELELDPSCALFQIAYLQGTLNYYNWTVTWYNAITNQPITTNLSSLSFPFNVNNDGDYASHTYLDVQLTSDSSYFAEINYINNGDGNSQTMITPKINLDVTKTGIVPTISLSNYSSIYSNYEQNDDDVSYPHTSIYYYTQYLDGINPEFTVSLYDNGTQLNYQSSLIKDWKLQWNTQIYDSATKKWVAIDLNKVYSNSIIKQYIIGANQDEYSNLPTNTLASNKDGWSTGNILPITYNWLSNDIYIYNNNNDSNVNLPSTIDGIDISNITMMRLNCEFINGTNTYNSNWYYFSYSLPSNTATNN